MVKEYYKVLRNNPLFSEIQECEFEQMLQCTSAYSREYKKNDVILLAGSPVEFMGCIISGSVKSISESAEGDIMIHSILSAPGLFMEDLACIKVKQSPFTFLAAEPSYILFFNYERITRSCEHACKFHTRLIRNMLYFIAKKNMLQTQKLLILSKHSLRERILLFLRFQRKENQASEFTIPYNRQELSEYLCVNRSALSNELCKMREEGILAFERNRFCILELK